MATVAIAMMARPSQTRLPARSGGVRPGNRSTPMAMSAPTPSCHARVGSEKKAHGAAMSVQMSASTSDPMTTLPTMSQSRPSVSRRSDSRTMRGQKR